MERLHDKLAAEAFDRNDNTTWQAHSAAGRAFSYVEWLLSNIDG